MGSFGALDYVIFFATVGISMAIGLFHAFRNRTNDVPDTYFLAGRKLWIVPAAISFVVSHQSSLLILGLPVEAYLYGAVVFYQPIGAVVAYVFAAITMVPVFHRLRLTSVYRYFELRYQGRLVKNIVMTGAIIFTLFTAAIVTYGACVALEFVMGMPYWVTILIYSIITALYTSLGGIKAVIWTDVFQVLIMITGVVAVHVKTTLDVGGSQRVLQLAASRFNMDDLQFDLTKRYSVWTTSIWSIVAFLYMAFTQQGVQRVNSTPNISSGRWLFIVSVPIAIPTYVLSSFLGVSAFAYYSSKGCDVIASKTAGNVNVLIPMLILDIFQNVPGMSGLFVAALSSAVLSTLSSFLNSLSAITYEDIIKVAYPDISDKRATLLSKAAVLIYGLIGMTLTFVVSQIPGSVFFIFIALISCMQGPTVAIFLMSIMWRRSTSPGMVIGGLAGLGVTLWIYLGRMMSSSIPSDAILPAGPTSSCPVYDVINSTSVPLVTSQSSSWQNTSYNEAYASEGSLADRSLTTLEHLYAMSPFLYCVVGMVITLVVGVCVSLLTKPPTVIDERCLFSLSRDLFQSDVTSDSNAATDDEQEMTQGSRLADGCTYSITHGLQDHCHLCDDDRSFMKGSFQLDCRRSGTLLGMMS